MLVRSFVIALFVTSLSAHAGTVYKWTDAEGRTHFSDEPPPNGQQVERLRTQGSAKSAAAGSPQFRQRKCRQATEALASLNRVEDVPADDSQWQASRNKMQAEIGKWCE